MVKKVNLKLERTPEAVAVSGIYGGRLAGVAKTPAGFPQTNLVTSDKCYRDLEAKSATKVRRFMFMFC